MLLEKLNSCADCFHYIVMMSNLSWAFINTGNPFAPLSTAISHFPQHLFQICIVFLKSTLIKNILNMAYQPLQNLAPSHLPGIPGGYAFSVSLGSSHTDILIPLPCPFWIFCSLCLGSLSLASLFN